MNKNKDKNKNMVNKIIPAALASAAAAPGSPRSSSWLSRPRRALCIILGLCAASFFIIDIREINPPDRGGADETFTLTQRFYGVDAAEMERIAAIPLEDALSGIRGLKRVVSVSENGRARVVCWFEGRERGRYEAVREAAQRVYEALPPAAQRPEISTAGGSRVPVWTAAFTALDGAAGTVLEKAVKPALEGIPGAGDVEISGAGRKETALVLDHGETAARSLDAGTVAAVLGSNDTLLPGGSIRLDGRDIPVMVDGRYDGIEDMRGAIIPLANAQGGGGFVRLGDIAAVGEQERNHESRSRLNGKNIALAAV
ncbi:MAG: efflux RND transporter permease subunit, partial [Treponema sp.]|nr:efflux RND transporter permease subunit [Treponema sp.]